MGTIPDQHFQGAQVTNSISFRPSEKLLKVLHLESIASSLKCLVPERILDPPS